MYPDGWEVNHHTFLKGIRMNEYSVRLAGRRIVPVFAYSKAEVIKALEADGFDRSEVRSIRLVEANAADVGVTPYVAVAQETAA